MQIKILDRSTYLLSLFGLLLLSCSICLWPVPSEYEYEYNFAKFDGTSVKNLKDVTNGEPKLYMGYGGNGNDNVVTKQGIMVSKLFLSFEILKKCFWFFIDIKFEIFLIHFERFLYYFLTFINY